MKTFRWYEKLIKEREMIPKKYRGSKRRKRLMGGGRKKLLSDVQEEEIERYIVELRGPPDHSLYHYVAVRTALLVVV